MKVIKNLLVYATTFNFICYGHQLGDKLLKGNTVTDNNGNLLDIDYYLSYTGLNYEGKINNYRFSSKDYINYNSSTNKTLFENCISSCSNNNECKGLYIELTDYPDFIDDFRNYEGSGEDNYNAHNYTGVYCYLLSDLGYPLETNNISYSYTKTSHYTDINSTHLITDEHSITGFIDNLYDYDTELSIVYLDLNHNGKLDINEPNKSVVNGYFVFDNLQNGNYLVRLISPDGCTQFYPGINGSGHDVLGFEDSSFITGEGFVDVVDSYYHHGHSKFIGPHGGFVEDINNIQYINNNFSYILGNDSSTYLSFYPEYNITFGFIDETILALNSSNNLFFDLYNNSSNLDYETSTKGNVSVSHDGINYYHIGILSINNTILILE